MEILETFPRVFCFPKSRINENGGNSVKVTEKRISYSRNYAEREKKFTQEITRIDNLQESLDLYFLKLISSSSS